MADRDSGLTLSDLVVGKTAPTAPAAPKAGGFDVDGARKAGYTDAQIADTLGQRAKFDSAGARQAGYTDAQIIQNLLPKLDSFKVPPTAAEKEGGGIGGGIVKGLTDLWDATKQNAPRGVDLLSRAVTSGIVPGANLPGLLLEGGRKDILQPTLQKAGQAADAQVAADEAKYQAARAASGREGFDAARLTGNIINPVNYIGGKALGAANTIRGLATSGALAGAASAVGTTPVLDTGDGSLGDFIQQKGEQATVGAVTGGILAPVLGKTIQYAATKLKGSNAGEAAGAYGKLDANAQAQIDQHIELSLKQDKIDPADISATVFNKARDDAAQAVKTGGTFDAAASIRKADFDRLDLPATRGQIQRDPMQWTLEDDVAKLKEGAPVRNLKVDQRNKLYDAFQTRGAANGGESAQIGDVINNALTEHLGNRAAARSEAYGAAKALNGRDIELHPSMSQNVIKNLDKEMVGGFLPDHFKEMLNGITSGKVPLTVSSAEQMKSVIGTAMAGATDGNVRKALGIFRDGLDNAVPDTQLGADALKAFAKARSMARGDFQEIDATPALKAVKDGMPVDGMFKKFALNGNRDELNSLLSILDGDKQSFGGNKLMTEAQGKALQTGFPEARKALADQTVMHLRDKAFGNNAAGDGDFAAARFNNELQNLGRNKLVALLGEQRADDMFAAGRAMAYSMTKPTGAAPNPSGTAGALVRAGGAKALEGAATANGIPGVNLLLKIVSNAKASADASKAANEAISPLEKSVAQLSTAEIKRINQLLGIGTALSPAPVLASDRR